MHSWDVIEKKPRMPSILCSQQKAVSLTLTLAQEKSRSPSLLYLHEQCKS